MKTRTTPVEIPAHLRPILQAAAKNLLHHLYGPQGPPWGTTLDDIEQTIVQLSKQLGCELLQQSLQRQAQQPLPPPLQTCPSCGGPVQPEDPEPRSLPTTLGIVDWQEPTSTCGSCRKAFFPSVGFVGH